MAPRGGLAPVGGTSRKYLKKGSKVYIEGKLRTRKWEKDGVDRYTTGVMADEMTLLDRPGGQAQETGQAQGQAQPTSAAPAKTSAPTGEDLDDLPFSVPCIPPYLIL